MRKQEEVIKEQKRMIQKKHDEINRDAKEAEAKALKKAQEQILASTLKKD